MYSKVNAIRRCENGDATRCSFGSMEFILCETPDFHRQFSFGIFFTSQQKQYFYANSTQYEFFLNVTTMRQFDYKFEKKETKQFFWRLLTDFFITTFCRV